MKLNAGHVFRQARGTFAHLRCSMPAKALPLQAFAQLSFASSTMFGPDLVPLAKTFWSLSKSGALGDAWNIEA